MFSVTKVLVETHARARAPSCASTRPKRPIHSRVVFTLKAPFAPFLNSFDCTTAPIVPKHIYDGTDFRKNPANAQAIGSGPFKLKEWVKGSPSSISSSTRAITARASRISTRSSIA